MLQASFCNAKLKRMLAGDQTKNVLTFQSAYMTCLRYANSYCLCNGTSISIVWKFFTLKTVLALKAVFGGAIKILLLPWMDPANMRYLYQLPQIARQVIENIDNSLKEEAMCTNVNTLPSLLIIWSGNPY